MDCKAIEHDLSVQKLKGRKPKVDFLGKRILFLYFNLLFCMTIVVTPALSPPSAYSAEVTLQWDPVAEADGYKIYYGLETRTYQLPENAGNQSSYTLSLDPGIYYLAVTAYNNYGESGYSEEVSTTVPETNPPTSVYLTSDLPSPQSEGTPVIFTAQAEGGSGDYEYKFFLKNPLDEWSIVREYASDSNYTWIVTGNGESAIQVWARNTGSDVEYSVLDTISFSTAVNPPTSVSLTCDLPSPQPEGTTVTFSAEAEGGSGDYEYKFFLKGPLDQWSIVREYASEPIYIWTATGNGESAIQVWARNTGSDVEYSVLDTVNFSTAVNPPTTVYLVPDLPSPQLEGTIVTFAAQAEGGSGLYQYKFLLRSTDGVWSTVQDYSSASMYTWYATLNIDNVGVHVRNEGSDQSYEVYTVIPFTVEPAPSVTEPPVSAMHVEDIRMSLKKAGPNVVAKAQITVKDNMGNPVEGAEVHGSWSGITDDNDSSVTDDGGIVLLKSDKKKRPSGTYIFTVNDIIKDGWSYDSAYNVEVSNSITVP